MNNVERKAVAYMYVGELYPSNYWGDMEIVEYKSSKNIIIRFVDSGNIYKVQRDNVLKGLVKDVERSKKLTQERYAEENRRRQEVKERAEVLVEHLKKDAEEAKRVRKAEAKERAAGMGRWHKILREYMRHFCKDGDLMYGRNIVDRNGFTYKIIIKKSFDKSSWAICYNASGNTYWVDEEATKSGNTYDKLNEDAVKAEKLRLKMLNARKYEEDRERRIAMASAYQKQNVERTRVRNRNRRARREGAEGTHTLEEVTYLLTQQENKCACCDVELTESSRELDHIMPLALGGTNYISNLQWLCQFCNSAKCATHPDEWAIYAASEDFKKRRQERLSTAAAN
jgi:5-methylcytosine-specific restriction endonuclease McrA